MTNPPDQLRALAQQWRECGDEAERRKEECFRMHHWQGEAVNRAELLTLQKCASELEDKILHLSAEGK